MKHTQGEWRIIPCTHSSDKDPRPYIFADQIIDGVGQSVLICKVENKNDAPVLSVAPEMLEALIEIRSALRDNPDIRIATISVPAEIEMDAITERIDSIISKAEGE